MAGPAHKPRKVSLEMPVSPSAPTPSPAETDELLEAAGGPVLRVDGGVSRLQLGLFVKHGSQALSKEGR